MREDITARAAALIVRESGQPTPISEERLAEITAGLTEDERAMAFMVARDAIGDHLTRIIESGETSS